MAHFVYIMRSLHSGRLYVGTTDHVRRRLQEHNRGFCRSTKPWRPWELVYTEAHADVAAARRREWQLKCTPAGGKEKRKLAQKQQAVARHPCTADAAMAARRSRA